MLSFNNRIYSGAELQAMSRLDVTGRQPILAAAATEGRSGPSGHRVLLAVAKRLLRRRAVGQPAPGTI